MGMGEMNEQVIGRGTTVMQIEVRGEINVDEEYLCISNLFSNFVHEYVYSLK